MLPAKTAFPAVMPRYPNAWFYIDASSAPSLEAAVRLVTGGLRQAIGALDKFRVSIAMFPGRTADRNTERIGIAVLEPKP